mgnify:CR=1 FL=1
MSLLGTAEPCYESASLEVFSCGDFKQQLADMMQEFKDVAADDRTVVNTRHTTLKSLLADEAVVAVLANIGNPEHTRVKRSVALCEVADAG